MTAEIINLRRARKLKARADREREAAVKRQSFGRTKAARRHEAATKALDDTSLDGKQRQSTPGSTCPSDRT